MRDGRDRGCRERSLGLRETHTGWAPGERFLYSNVGYKTLGLVLEAVTGRPWWEVVLEGVMEPIGMREADVDHHERLACAPRARPYVAVRRPALAAPARQGSLDVVREPYR